VNGQGMLKETMAGCSHLYKSVIWVVGSCFYKFFPGRTCPRVPIFRFRRYSKKILVSHSGVA